MKNKNKILGRLLCMFLAFLMPFGTCAQVFAQAMDSGPPLKASQSALGSPGTILPQSIQLDTKNGLADITQGDTITIGQNGQATILNNGESPNQEVGPDQDKAEEDKNQPVDLMGGETMDVEVTENGNDITVTPDLPEPNIRYDAEAAAAAEGNENMEYKGTFDGTALSAYKSTPRSDATPFTSIMEEDKTESLKRYYETDVIAGDALTAAVNEADGFSRTVAEKLKNPEELAKLGVDTPTGLFKMVSESPTGDPSQDIIIVDDRTVVIRVTDQNGKGINGAAVTLKFKDKDNRDVTKNAVTGTSNGKDGFAIITDMAGTRSGFLNIEKDGYRVLTQLDADLDGGSILIHKLTPTNAKDVYVRCADLEGSDLINKPNTISLTPNTTRDLNLTVLLSGGSMNHLRMQDLRIKAKNPSSGDREFKESSKTELGEKTIQFTYTKRWAEKLLDPDTVLKAKDVLTIEETHATIKPVEINMKVKDAVVEKATWNNIKFSIVGAGGSFTIPKSVPAIGNSKLDVDFLKLPITLIIGLDGTAIFSYKADIETIIDQKEFLTSDFIPRKQEKAKTIRDKVQNAFNAKMKAFSEGKGLMTGDSESRFPIDGSHSVKVNFMAMGSGSYDWKTGYITLSTSMMVALEGKYGMTFYAIIPPSVYAGFNASASLSASGGVGIRFKPKDFINTATMSNAGLLDTIDLALGLGVYAGVGLHGLFCIEADGGILAKGTLDFRLNETDRPKNKMYPRATVDLGYNVGVTAVALFFKYHKDFLGKTWTVYDSWHLKDKETALEKAMEETTRVYQIKFEGQEEAVADNLPAASADGTLSPTEIKADKQVSEEDATPENINGLSDGADGTGFKAADATSGNSRLAYIDQDGKTYAFRIVLVKYSFLGYTYPALVYQKEKEDGNGFENQFYQIPYFGNYYYDYDFAAYTHQQEGSGKHLTALNIISGYRGYGYSDKDCAKHTISRVVQLDLTNNKILMNEVVRDDKNGTYKHSPTVYSYENRLIAGWLEADSMEDAQQHKNIALYTADNYMAGNGKLTVTPYPGRRNYISLQLGTENKSLQDWYNEVSLNMSFVERKTDGNGAPYDVYSMANHRSQKPEKQYFSGQSITNIFVGPSLGNVVKGGTYVNVDGMLKVINQYGQVYPVEDTGNNPFQLPKNTQVYDIYLNNSLDVAKLVTVTKEIRTENGKDVTDSLIHVYDLAPDDSIGHHVKIHGPRTTRLANRNIANVTGMYYYHKDHPDAPNSGLRLLYTADTESKVIKEGTMRNDGSYEPGEVIEACTLYRWNEGLSASAKATAIGTDEPYIKKSQGSLTATVKYENNGVRVLDDVTVQITDKQNNVLCEQKVEKRLYPGEGNSVKMTFKPHQSWQPGSETLFAKVTKISVHPMSAVAENGEITELESGTILDNPVAEGDIASTGPYDKPAVLIEAAPVIIDGRYYGAINISNESMVPVEDAKVNVYKLKSGQKQEKKPDYTYNIGELSEAYGEDYTECSYNFQIPLDECWKMDETQEILIEITAANMEDIGPFVTEIKIENPSFPVPMMVATRANDETYGSLEGDGYYIAGETATVKAEAREGYRFVKWTDEAGNTVSDAASYSFKVGDEGVSLTAVFEEIGSIHKVVLIPDREADGADKGLVDSSGANDIDALLKKSYTARHGQEITVEATAYPGYRFKEWVELDTEGTTGAALSGEASYTFAVDREIRLMAVFVPDVGHTLWLDARGGDCGTATLQTDEGGKITGELPTAEKTGYRFDGWFDNIEEGSQVTPETVFQTDYTLYARYTALPDTQFTIEASAGNGGSIEPAGKINVTPGSDMAFKAVPKEGYVVKNWKVDGQDTGSTADSYTFNKVDRNHTVEVQFQKKTDPQKPDPQKPDGPGTGLTTQNWAVLTSILLVLMAAFGLAVYLKKKRKI